jgi:Tfp pilus assembly protein PilV
MLKRSFFSKTKGFSIGEVILASFILTTGLIAVSALVASSYRQALVSRDAIIATGLAQEGVELVRNVRDNDLAAGGTGFAEFSNSHKHCRIDYNDALVLDCTAASGALSRYTLQYGSNGYYAHANTASERFSRHIYIDYNTTAENALIRSFVYMNPSLYTPPSDGNANGCTAASKCAYTEVTLTAWK